ncbi:MAG: alpha/beta hydrolase [Steroidobacteraceae bacterium]
MPVHSRRKWVLLSLLALACACALVVGNFIAARRSAAPSDYETLRSQYGHGSRQIVVAGVRVNYRDDGDGPVLVLLHGSFGSLRMFDDVTAELDDRFRIIRYDQPPSGLSGAVPEGFALSPEQFLADFLDALHVDKAALLGTSSGGIIGYRFAATYPQRTTALVLSNVPPSAPVDNNAARQRLPLLLRWSIATCMQSRPWSRTCWQDFLRAHFERRERVTPALVDEYFDLNRRPGATQFTSMTAIMKSDAEVRRFLAAVSAPTLILWGARDPVLPRATAELLAARVGSDSKRVVYLDDVSHYPPLEAPHEVAGATREFLEAVPAIRLEQVARQLAATASR